ncbi:hypothetical protein A8924_0950 [Saccharopolyspora erythraea NRRL 2338]|uniref:Uncharacterized protein n=2 Tax=Saccharopolyspora erythraea TaxID=1836 RepID=A4F772_SACEN|nr:hypothetical protein [Saccharopolyspora erythraea]PFG93699.1 hypothetical protein A8924_0950 [Saccharopolyspora erythraea NRRL 2338]QRK90543.1 hypothetical protein JQX30_03300 [Saccharopolyspora erythraea]CAL99896.1 hypothetical protein SACE_0550 [Saccharopolyspora erythraea NRRL 2338]
MTYPPQQQGPYGQPGRPQGYPQQPGFPQSGPQAVPGQAWGAPQYGPVGAGYPTQTGQVPPGQAPHAQMPPGQVPPGQVPPQGQGFGPPPVPPQPSKGGGGALAAKIISGVVALAVVGLILLGINMVSGSGAPEAGECLNLTNNSTVNPDWEVAPCGSADSDFVIAKQLGGSESCGEDFSEVSKSGRRTSGYTLCLVPDVKAGDCMNIPQYMGLEEKVACGDADANMEILSVENSTAGESACDYDQEFQYIVYNEPAPGRTICMKQV